MAGEIYIARQDTLEAVQGTVEVIDTKADTTINTLGNFAGGGIEDSVISILQTLTKKIEAIGGGESNIKINEIYKMLCTNKIEASDNLLLTVSNKEISVSSKETDRRVSNLAGSFKSDLTGMVRIRVRIKHPSGNGNSRAVVRLNETDIGQSAAVTSVGDYVIKTFDVPIIKNNTYSIYLYGGGSAGYTGTGYLNLAEVLGTYTTGVADYIYKV